ncbi:MAG: TetR/AcrR family transcriptional regulator [Actinomycetota bacterium]
MGGESKRPGPDPKISRDDIIEAALSIGFEKLTLTAIARRLGVSQNSLYHYVDDRADVVAAAMDHVVERMAWPPQSDDWRRQLGSIGTAFFDTMIDYPGLARLVEQADHPPEFMQRRFGETHAHLMSLGFGSAEALLAMDVVYDLAIDSAARSARLERHFADPAKTAASWEHAPTVDIETALALGASDRGASWFRHKLQIALSGIAAEIGPDRTTH